MNNQDDLATHINALEKEVERYRKAREREKKARLRAEELLEVKSRELFQTHEDLKQAEVQFRSIFENAIECIYQTTPDGDYIRANPRLIQIRGYESFDALKKELNSSYKCNFEE
jgi:PAS domain-containing protein